MKYHYLFSDMDGTLLNSSGSISTHNLQAIRSFMQMGGCFTIATGRSDAITRPFLKDLKLNFPAILYNGAAIYDFYYDRFLYKQYLPHSAVHNIITTALTLYPSVCIEGFTEGPIKLLNSDGIEDHLLMREKQPCLFSSYQTSDEYIKLIFYGEHSLLREIKLILDSSSKGQFTSIFSAPFYLEILPEQCSKGRALTWLIKHYALPKQFIAAIGDFDNDLEMLKTASLGAAPANASDHIRSQADIIVSDHDHNAVAELIYQHIL